MPGRSKKSIHEIAISEFKAKCLSLLEEVSKTKTPLRVTRRGKAVADVILPPQTQKKGTGLVQCPVRSKSQATSSRRLLKPKKSKRWNREIVAGYPYLALEFGGTQAPLTARAARTETREQ